MDERQEKSILEMGRGAIMERADYEMRAMIRNILDPNTSAKAARKLNITLTFKPGDDRQTIVVECVAKSTLASTNAITTMLYVLDEDTVVEMAPQIPGQLAVDAGEQEAPPKLRLIHSAYPSRTACAELAAVLLRARPQIVGARERFLWLHGSAGWCSAGCRSS